METRTEIYSKAELEGGYFYVVEKNKIIRRLNVKGEGLTIEQFRKDNMAYIEYLKNKLECSNCIYSIGDSGEVGIADYTDELMWHPQIKDLFVRNLTEDDRKAISEAIEEAERKHLEAMEQYKMNFYSDKNNTTKDFYIFKRVQRLREMKAKLFNLIDTTLGLDIVWRMDNLNDVKDLIDNAKDESRISQIFAEAYNYAREKEEEEEVIQAFKEFGTYELDLRFCEECGKVMGEGYYFPSFESKYLEHTPEYMCVKCFDKKPEAFKDEWRTYWNEDIDDCFTEWGI